MPIALNNSGVLFHDNTTETTAFPVGAIILWSGSAAAIPTGWILCNGASGTPDLRNRFIVGAASTYAVNATGGSTDAITPSHNHTATVSDPSHRHTYTNFSSSAIRAGSNGGNPSTNSPRTTDSNTTGISVSISTEGVSGTNANLPPYYALCYIYFTG
jgi:microcystin-dependent protein